MDLFLLRVWKIDYSTIRKIDLHSILVEGHAGNIRGIDQDLHPAVESRAEKHRSPPWGLEEIEGAAIRLSARQAHPLDYRASRSEARGRDSISATSCFLIFFMQRPHRP